MPDDHLWRFSVDIGLYDQEEEVRCNIHWGAWWSRSYDRCFVYWLRFICSLVGMPRRATLVSTALFMFLACVGCCCRDNGAHS